MSWPDQCPLHEKEKGAGMKINSLISSPLFHSVHMQPSNRG